MSALSARLDAAEEIAEALPHRARYLRHVHRLGRALLQVHRDWVDEVERDLGRPEGAPEGG